MAPTSSFASQSLAPGPPRSELVETAVCRLWLGARAREATQIPAHSCEMGEMHGQLQVLGIQP